MWLPGMQKKIAGESNLQSQMILLLSTKYSKGNTWNESKDVPWPWHVYCRLGVSTQHQSTSSLQEAFIWQRPEFWLHGCKAISTCTSQWLELQKLSSYLLLKAFLSTFSHLVFLFVITSFLLSHFLVFLLAEITWVSRFYCKTGVCVGISVHCLCSDSCCAWDFSPMSCSVSHWQKLFILLNQLKL